MSTGSAVGLSGDVRLLRTLKTVLPALNLKLLAPPGPVPNADAASPDEIRVALVDADYPDNAAVLKWLEPDRRIPVILMREDDLPLARSLRGAAAVLYKPLDPQKLRAAVELLVPDWDAGAGREPRLADILDLFGSPRPSPDSAEKPVRETPPCGPKTEDEIDRILGTALAEIGLPAESLEAPRPAAPASPRPPEPGPLRPTPPPQLSALGLRKIPPAFDLPEEFPAGPESAPPALLPSVRRPLGPESVPEEGESPLAPLAPAANRRSRPIPLIAGLALAVFIGAAYLAFGRRAPKPAPPAAAPAPVVERAVVRSNRREAAVVGASASDQAAAQQRTGEAKPAETKSEGPEAAAFAAPPQRPEEKPEPEKDLAAPIRPAADGPAKSEAETKPPAGMKETPPGVPPAKDESAPKGKTEETPAPLKTAAEPAARPDPVKGGDLVDLAAVDIPPALLNSVEPVYPPLAFQNKQQGKVTLTVLISEKGEILEAKPGGEPGADQGFVKAALRAVRRWSYSPAFKDGVAVRVWKTLVIDFKIR